MNSLYSRFSLLDTISKSIWFIQEQCGQGKGQHNQHSTEAVHVDLGYALEAPIRDLVGGKVATIHSYEFANDDEFFTFFDEMKKVIDQLEAKKKASFKD